MKNIQNMKFKVGSYFIWEDAIFKILYIKDDVYTCKNYDIEGPESNVWSFFNNEEHSMKYISKKKNPEYFL